MVAAGVNMSFVEASKMVATSNPCLLEASEMVASAALQLQSGDSNSRDMCRHWAKGYCALGENCAFPHNGPSPMPSSGGSVVVNGVPADAIPSAAELRKQDLFAVVKSSVPCKDYQAAKCHRGDKCKFAHVGGGPARRSVACRDWRQGRCTRGDACRYRHTGGRRQADEDCYDDDYQQEEQHDTAPYPTTVVKYVVNPAHQTMPAPTYAPTPSVQRIVRYYTTTPSITPSVPPTLNGLPVAQTSCDYITPQSVQPVCDYAVPPLTPLTPACDFGVQSSMPPTFATNSPLTPTDSAEWVTVPQIAPSPPPQQQMMDHLEPPAHMSPPPATPEEMCADADATVLELRRRAEEMEAHAASLRAMAQAEATSCAPVYQEVPMPNTYQQAPEMVCPESFYPAGPRQSGSSAGYSSSADTTPTSPRRSSSTCSGGGSEGGEGMSSPPGVPCSPDPSIRVNDNDTNSQNSRQAPVMVHDPYAM